MDMTDGKRFCQNTQKIMMMNCFCRMVDNRKKLNLISSQNHCKRFLPLPISNILEVGFEPTENLISNFAE